MPGGGDGEDTLFPEAVRLEGGVAMSPAPADPIRLEGRVERTVYYDAESRYTVLRVFVEGRSTLVTAVGRSSGIEDGAEVALLGQWGSHRSHGHQFEFTRLDARAPSTALGVRRRLMRYPGIREVLAERIVFHFGVEALEVLEREPDRYLEVEGVGPKTLERLRAHHESQGGPLEALEGKLAELQVSPHHAPAILERYGNKSLEMLTQSPYRLAREIRGIGFLTADRMAYALGVATMSPERVDAGVLFALDESEQDGHSCLPEAELVRAATRVLRIDEEAVQAGLQRLEATGALVLEADLRGSERLCFSHRMWMAETRVADSLLALARAPRPIWQVPPLPAELSEGQRRAVEAVARGGVVVLTGGPGTGKSTVLRSIKALAEAGGAEVLFAAPTGRAAKRLEEAGATGATTIHRLLGVEGQTGRFTHGPGYPLPPGLVVIDESSMLDVRLASSLLSALEPGEHRLLLVGDADQLPSVGPGNVLRDVIDASPDVGLEVVRLTEIFRQAEGSSIVRSAHRIRRGEVPQADDPGSRTAPRDGPPGEFFVVTARDASHAHDLVLRLVTERIPEAFGLDPTSEIQVLCPMHKGPTGTLALNTVLSAHHQAGRAELRLPVRGHKGEGRVFRLGDRVMQTRNDHDRGVYNGDIGTVAAVHPGERSLIVEIDGQPIPYTEKELSALVLAYAVTIHKSQGSEFPAVVLPILADHHVMLRRNLLYTAVTRARRLVVVVTDGTGLRRALAENTAAERFSGLRRRLIHGGSELRELPRSP